MAGHEPEKGEVNVQTPTERLHDDIREDKDCTDQLLECTTECAPTDAECHAECVEEYKECDLPWEDDVQMTYEEDKFMEMDEGELISELLQIASLLGGTVERTQTLDSTGRSSNKIIIEYNVTNTTTD
tara:strand:- start:1069 stop:1452 length:384 start_codon:yes stop_codon:yes gene_type:complete